MASVAHMASKGRQALTKELDVWGTVAGVGWTCVRGLEGLHEELAFNQRPPGRRGGDLYTLHGRGNHRRLLGRSDI